MHRYWIALLLIAGTLHGQNAKRPKIGLVLAGGSAHGLAHLGVIRWLEEHRIPVDLVTGTSMGGLVGGLYATGRDSAEMLAFVREIDWERALQGSPAYSDLSYRRKEDRRELFNTLELGLKGGLRLPAGLVPGQEIGLLFNKIQAPYAAIPNFDALPIPFRCTASDLITGDLVVFRDGSLASALRATMSIPGLFSPVRANGKVLADGGLLDNLPADLAKEMGAEVIIAVDLSDPPVDPKTLDSIFGIAGRSVSVMIAGNVRRNHKLADLILNPDLKGISSSEFERYAELAERGYQEAQRKSRFLETLSVGEAEYAEHLRQRRARIRKFQSVPRFVTVSGVSPRRAAWLRDHLREFTGKPLDSAALERALTRLTGLGAYEVAGWTPVSRNGEDGLEIEVREKTYLPPVLNPGFTIDGSQVGSIGFGIGGRVTWYDLGSPGSEVRVDIGVGQVNFARGEYFWRFRPNGWFLAPRGQADRTLLPLYLENERLAEYSFQNYGGGLDLGYNWGRLNELRVGFTSLWQRAALRTGISGLLPEPEGLSNSVGFRYVFDGANHPLIYNRGARVTLTGDYFVKAAGSERRFGRIEARGGFARPLFTPKGFGLIGLSGGSTLGDSSDSLVFFTLGGPLRLGSLGFNQRIGNSYYLGTAGYLYQVGKLPPILGGSIYAGAFYQAGDAFLRGTRHSLYQDGSLALLGETKIGIMFLGASFANRAKFYFGLGRFF
jgi:NTE family protein